MRKQPKYGRFEVLPPDFASTVTDCTVAEAASFRRCSVWRIFKKIRKGEIDAYPDGGRTKIKVASLVADRERAIAASPPRPLDATRPVAETVVDGPTTKRRQGRPRKVERVLESIAAE